jgi:ATP-dependent Clp protease ATP-binding subunit ClpX
LQFEKQALEAIADLAISRNTGARGLRAILEDILGPVMFELPGSAITGVVKITKDNVINGGMPQVIPFKSQQDKSA